MLFSGGSPLDLNNQPVLLFFNNDDGCECVVPLYQKADVVTANWPAANRGNIPVRRIVLDERPDLQRAYNIQRAPMILLLDAQGREVWRGWGVASNPNVFELAAGEAQIRAAALEKQ